MARPVLSEVSAAPGPGGAASRKGRSFVKSVARARMSLAAAERYTRFVEFLKVLLPAFAFALVAVVALFAVTHRPENVLTVEFDRVERLEDDLTMVGPRFRGVDAAGRPFTVTAVRARQTDGNAETVLLDDVRAEMALDDMPTVGRVVLTAREGILENVVNKLQLSGGVRVATGGGDELRTEAFSADFEARRGESLGPVAGEGPMGRVRADRLVVADAGSRLIFEGRVRTVIHQVEETPLRPARSAP